MFAEFEEKYGLLNHAIEIYDQLIQKVDEKNRKECYQIYISKVAEFLGVTKTRPIFEVFLIFFFFLNFFVIRVHWEHSKILIC